MNLHLQSLIPWGRVKILLIDAEVSTWHPGKNPAMLLSSPSVSLKMAFRLFITE